MTSTLIIGGGIIGMMTAWKLKQSGHQVTLIEKGQTGRESTWAGGGIISPLYPWRYHEAISALAGYGQQHYPQLCEELLQIAGVDPQYTRSGLLIIAPEEQQAALDWALKFHPTLSLEAPDQLAQIEPAMRIGGVSGIWMPDIAQVRNPRIARALTELMPKLGIEVITDTAIDGFQSDGNQVSAVISGGKTFSADRYVVCSGAWTGDLLQQTGLTIPVKPVKGQMILFRAKPGDIQRIVLEEDRYVIPRRDGRVLFGSTVEHSGFDKAISDAARDELHAIAVERFPILKNCEIEHHWAGLRPGSPDGIPVIGRHPAFENLFINAGQFRNGVVLAAGSCELVARLVNGESCELDNPIFSPRQFVNNYPLPTSP
jgi:glycine oxidase